ncbi:hypothetical protein FRC01_004817 [Tulasnella sp. 417]|nr:hypothetical protein FRC01_004817 [Tulasnella sp. 417]
MSLVGSTQASFVAPSYELVSSDLDSGADSFSTPRCLSGSSSRKLALNGSLRPANPPAPPANIYSIIVAVASSVNDQAEYLQGVEGDLAFVFDELGGRATDPIRVITDVRGWNNREQVLSPSLQSVEASIEEVGRSLKPGDLCYIYIGGHAEMESGETSFMPLPNGERLRGNVLASWLEAAAAGGGRIIAIVDVCHSSAFLKMASVYDIKPDGVLYCTTTRGKEDNGSKGEVIIISSTLCGQLALTIEIPNGKNAGRHGFFTWVLFKHLRGLLVHEWASEGFDGTDTTVSSTAGLPQRQQADAGKLLKALRAECARHTETKNLCPQLSATREGLQELPIGQLPAKAH